MATILVAIYLAWILRRIEAIVGGDPRKYTIAVGAPMNHKDHAELTDRYLRAVHAAYLAAFGDEHEAPLEIEQGVRLADVQSRVEKWLETEVPPGETRRFDVKPETLAPLVSLHRDPKLKQPGVYMIVDMGAGSTEISVNQIQDTGNPEPCVHCHEDRTARLGGDEFAANDEKNAFDAGACESAEQSLVDKFWDHYRKVCLAGYTKTAHETPGTRAPWAHMRIVQVGGALRRPSLQNRIGSLPPLREWVPDAKHQANWHAPSALDCWPAAATEREVAEWGPIFAVADGLSIHPWWPEWESPDEIEAGTPRERSEEPRYNE
jgi:hypothetical protein